MIINFLSAIVNLFIDMAPYLLLGLIFVGILHVFIKKDTITKHIGRNSVSSVIKSSLLGVPLPLCSCGVVPTAIQLRKSGASKGAVISFLISTPQTGVDSIIATFGMMGTVFAIYRPFAAFISGILGGVFVNLFVKNDFNFEKVADCSCNGHGHHEHYEHVEIKNSKNNIFSKLKQMFNYSFSEFLDDISIHFLVGLIVAALITVIIPDTFFADLNLNSGIIAMLIMIVIGLPMYICSTSSIPVAIALLLKGFSPGAAFVFLFVGPVTNAASITVLIKSLGKKTVAIYIGIVSIVAILFGLLLDYLYRILDLKMQLMNYINNSTHQPSVFKYILAGIFAILFIKSLIKNIINKINRKKEKKPTGECNHEANQGKEECGVCCK